MAPKAAKKARLSVFDPILHEDELVSPHDLSLGDDSGWRNLSEEHMNFLFSECLGGQYNKTNIKQPIVFKSKMASDGKRQLLNGKHIVWAVLESEKVYKAMNEDDSDAAAKALQARHSNAEFNASLVKAFTEMRVSVIEFPAQFDDPDWLSLVTVFWAVLVVAGQRATSFLCKAALV